MADRTKTISASFAVRYVAQDGADAEYYNLVLSSETIKKDSSGNALTALTASVQHIVGATLTEYTTAAELSSAGITITYSRDSMEDNIIGTGVSVSTTYLASVESYIGVMMYVNGTAYTSKKVFIVQDGADGGGEDAIVMALSNSASVVLCQQDGTVIDETNGYETTTAYMYDGTTDVTDDTTFVISSTSGITASVSGNVITISDITEDNAGVQIKGTYDGNVRYAYYSVKKLCVGADATFYRLIVGLTSIPCDSDGAVTIETIPLTVQKVQGTTITNLTEYSDVEAEGLWITADLTSTDNEVSENYYINDMNCLIASMVLSEEGWTGTFASVTFYLHPSSVTYNSGSDYDYQTINATRDGTDGTDGTAGADGQDGEDGSDANAISFTPTNIIYTPTTSTSGNTTTVECVEQDVTIQLMRNNVIDSNTKFWAKASPTAVNCSVIDTTGAYNEEDAGTTYSVAFIPKTTTVTSSATGSEYTIPATTGSMTFTFYVDGETDDDGNMKEFTCVVAFTSEVSSCQSSIVQDANSITSTVSELSSSVDGLKESYTEISQTVDDISLTVNTVNVANPNLLRNSLFNSANNIYLETIKIENCHTSETLQAGTTYTLAVRGYLNDDAFDANMQIHCGLYTYDGSAYSLAHSFYITATEDAIYTFTFEPTEDAVMYFSSALYYSDGEHDEGNRESAMAYVKWAKIEKGSSCTGYIRNTADEEYASTDGDNLLETPFAVNATDASDIGEITTDNRLGKVLTISESGVLDFGIKSAYTSYSSHLITYFVIAKNTSGADGDYLVFSAYGEATDVRILNTLTCEYVDVGSGWKLYYISYQTKTFSSETDTEGTLQPIVSNSSTAIGIMESSGTWNIWAAGVVLDLGVPAPAALIQNYQTLATGISITNGTITCTADNFAIQNNSGVTTMTVDADGMLEGTMFKSTDSGEGYVAIKDSWLALYDADGTKRIELGMFTDETGYTEEDEDTKDHVPCLRFYGRGGSFLYDLGPSMIQAILEENLQSLEGYTTLNVSVSSYGESISTELKSRDSYSSSDLYNGMVYVVATTGFVSSIIAAEQCSKTVYTYTPFQFGENYLAGIYAASAGDAEANRRHFFENADVALEDNTAVYGVLITGDLTTYSYDTDTFSYSGKHFNGSYAIPDEYYDYADSYGNQLTFSSSNTIYYRQIYFYHVDSSSKGTVYGSVLIGPFYVFSDTKS